MRDWCSRLYDARCFILTVTGQKEESGQTVTPMRRRSAKSSERLERGFRPEICTTLSISTGTPIPSQQLSELPGVIGTVDVVELSKKVHALPDDWRTSSALNNFAECLDRLSNAQLLHNVLETIVDNVLKIIVASLQWTNDGERFKEPLRRCVIL
jgi:hypothetical protein